jgi:hypothetical protein
MVDQGLIIPAARFFHLIAEPIQNVVVYADGDAGLSLWRRDHRAAFAFSEIVFLLFVHKIEYMYNCTQMQAVFSDIPPQIKNTGAFIPVFSRYFATHHYYQLATKPLSRLPFAIARVRVP